jgi:hypothetical protein
VHGDKREIAVLNVRNVQFITLIYLQPKNSWKSGVLCVETLLNIVFIQKSYSQIKRIPMSLICISLLSYPLNVFKLSACSGKMVII